MQRPLDEMIRLVMYKELEEMFYSNLLALKSDIRVIIFLDVSHQVLYNYTTIRCPLQLLCVY